MKDFLGWIGFGICVILMCKGCELDKNKPLIGINGSIWDTKVEVKS